MNDYVTLSAGEIVSGVRAGRVSAREITKAALDYIEATALHVNAFIHLVPEEALAQADAVDAARARGDIGALAGVPLSIKDTLNVAGMPTSLGSPLLVSQIAAEDSPVCRLARAAGAVMLGKTTTPEFAHKSFTDAALFGRTVNPWNPRFTSGGSSGGAAASVATGQTRIAVGTDGGGSVRIPASTCGVFGLKATLGKVPNAAAPDLFARNSYIGPIAASLDELRMLFDVMAVPDRDDPWSLTIPATSAPPELGRLRVGFALTVGNPVVETDVERAFERVRALIAGFAASTSDIEIDLVRYEEPLRPHWEAALAARLGDRLETDEDRIEAALVRKVRRGLQHSAMTLLSVAQVRRAMFRDIQSLFGRIDILVTPTLAAAGMAADVDFTDVSIGQRPVGHSRAGWHPYSWPFNLSGHPALTMPCGWTRDGLPVGVQLVGRWHDDDLLFNLAGFLDRELSSERRQWRPVATGA